MAISRIHVEYRIRCPKEIDPDQVNAESFRDFVPQNTLVTRVNGFTSKERRKNSLVNGKFHFHFKEVRFSTFINFKVKGPNIPCACRFRKRL